jgi:P-type Cu+ transporter
MYLMMVPMATRQISFAIQGLRGACAKCAVDIERALAQLDGVVAVHVNYATERATVIHDPARTCITALVDALRETGFDTPLQHITLPVRNLLYATSARMVEQALRPIAGVARVSADLATQRVTLDLFPDHAPLAEIERALSRLGLETAGAPSPHAARNFVNRSAIIAALGILVIWSAGAHAALWTAGDFHSPLVVMVLTVLLIFGVGWRFFATAMDAGLQGRIDAGVITALFASVFALVGLPLALISPNSWLTDFGFVAATVLTTGWFLARVSLLWETRFHRNAWMENPGKKLWKRL